MKEKVKLVQVSGNDGSTWMKGPCIKAKYPLSEGGKGCWIPQIFPRIMACISRSLPLVCAIGLANSPMALVTHFLLCKELQEFWMPHLIPAPSVFLASEDALQCRAAALLRPHL